MRLGLLSVIALAASLSIVSLRGATAAPVLGAVVGASPLPAPHAIENVYYWHGRHYPYRYRGRYYQHRYYRHGRWHYY